jgi:hypothetical protein
MRLAAPHLGDAVGSGVVTNAVKNRVDDISGGIRGGRRQTRRNTGHGSSHVIQSSCRRPFHRPWAHESAPPGSHDGYSASIAHQNDGAPDPLIGLSAVKLGRQGLSPSRIDRSRRR